MERGRISIATRYGCMMEVDNRKWMTGDGSQQMDHGRGMTIHPLPFYENIEVLSSYTILEITTSI